MNELKRWLELHSQAELGRRLGITQGAVSQWMAKGGIPLDRVRAVERATGIPASQLHPDFQDHLSPRPGRQR